MSAALTARTQEVRHCLLVDANASFKKQPLDYLVLIHPARTDQLFKQSLHVIFTNFGWLPQLLPRRIGGGLPDRAMRQQRAPHVIHSGSAATHSIRDNLGLPTHHEVV
jgi:hypothetical protein